MTPEDQKSAGTVLAMFDAVSLGDGDLAAGANTLAAMALVLAAVRYPVPALVSPDGCRTATSGGFLVSGPLSSSLIQEHVIGPLRDYQAALSAHVCDWQDEGKRHEERAARRKDLATQDDAAAIRETQISRIIRAAEFDELFKNTESYRALMDKPPGSAVTELRERSLVFASAGTPQAILNAMGQAHCGRPLIHVPLTVADGCQRLSRVCNRLLDGSLIPGRIPLQVRGELIVTDPGGVLHSSLREGGVGIDWLSRLPWLTDHAAHPVFEVSPRQLAKVKLGGVVDRFRNGLKRAWAERLADYGDPSSTIEADFQKTQASWVKTLISLESSFPGVSCSLRPLVASLIYGLYEIYVPRSEAVPIFTMDKVAALATMLALRMVNVRATAIHDERHERIAKRANAIRHKLAERGHTARDLCRRFNKLLLADCEEALGFLADDGIVECDGKTWQLVARPPQHGQIHSTPEPVTLNV